MSQTENSNEKTANFCSSSYQRYQGEKLAKRFNAYSYVALSKAMDSHNVARGRTSLFEALSCVKAKSLVIGITSDILFPLEEQQFLARHIPHAQLATITSKYGHDGFLLENKQLKACIEGFYAGQQQLLTNLN